MIETIINKAKTYVMGERTVGEKLNAPKFKTVYPEGYVHVKDIKKSDVDHGYNDWCKIIKFSSMYSKHYSDY